jgi:predicted NAD/FAD-dependent oxidoreductase
VSVEVRDRGRVIGGRMASRWLDGRIVDSGASYLTATSPEFTGVVDDWLARGVVRAWTSEFAAVDERAPAEGSCSRSVGPVRYSAPYGLRALVADLAARAGVRVAQSSPVRMIEPGPVVDGERFDAAVLAMPDPQAIRHLHPALEQERAMVAGRAWEPVLALLAGWPHRQWSPIDGVFVNGDSVLSWIADDGRRRGDEAPVLVAHSTSEFARPRLTEPAAAAADLVAATRRVLRIPGEPGWTYVQPWPFAKPAHQRDLPFFLTAGNVGLAGDGWGDPKIETAWRSGAELGRAIAERVGAG